MKHPLFSSAAQTCMEMDSQKAVPGFKFSLVKSITGRFGVDREPMMSLLVYFFSLKEVKKVIEGWGCEKLGNGLVLYIICGTNLIFRKAFFFICFLRGSCELNC